MIWYDKMKGSLQKGHTSLFWPKCDFRRIEPIFCMLACFYMLVNIDLFVCVYIFNFAVFEKKKACKKALFLLIQKDEFTTSVSSLLK